MADGRIARGAATRDRLVTAACAVFGQRGYDAASVTEILDAAGVAKGALYHHFDSKAGLFDAVLDRVLAELAEAAGAHASREADDDPAARLKAGCRAWLEMTLDPAVQRIVLLDGPAVVGWARARELDDRHTLRGIRHNLELIADREGDLAGGIDLLAHMVLAAVSEAALFIARAHDADEGLTVGVRTVETLVDRLSN